MCHETDNNEAVEQVATQRLHKRATVAQYLQEFINSNDLKLEWIRTELTIPHKHICFKKSIRNNRSPTHCQFTPKVFRKLPNKLPIHLARACLNSAIRTSFDLNGFRYTKFRKEFTISIRESGKREFRD